MALSITKPTVGGSEDTWGTTINTALDDIVSYANTAPQLGDANVFTAAQTVSANFIVDTNVLFVDASNDRVGIGTSSPVYTVDIQDTGDTVLRVKSNSSGAGNDDDAFLRLDAAETGETGIQFYQAGVDIGYGIDAFYTGGQMNFNVPAGSTFDFQINATLITRFDSTGILPGSDNTYDLGGASSRWDDIYATNGTIQTSDIRQKQDIEELNEAERLVAMKAKTLLRKYRWKDAVEEKGEDARIHIGIMAQDLIKAFEDEGLDAFNYAMIVGSEEDGYGVRYHELLAFIIAAW
jgi:hypothetical protein